MPRLEIKDNYLYIIDNTTEEIISKHPTKDTKVMEYEETSENPLYVFTGIESTFNSRSQEDTKHRFDDLLDLNGIAFTDISTLRTFIDQNTAGFSISQAGETVSRIGTEDSLDDATAAVPLVVLANTDKKITNNAFDIFNSLPIGLTKPIWDGINSRLDFSELKVGDAVFVSVNFSAITTSANTDIGIGVAGGTLAVPTFKRQMGRLPFKTNKTYLDETISGIILMKSQATVDGFGELFLRTDSNCSVIIKGIQIVHLLKGALL